MENAIKIAQHIDQKMRPSDLVEYNEFFDEMKDELQGWLKPSDEDGGKQTEVKAAPSKQKENIDSKLDQLFD